MVSSAAVAVVTASTRPAFSVAPSLQWTLSNCESVGLPEYFPF